MENGVILQTLMRRQRLLVIFMLALLLTRVPLVGHCRLMWIMLSLRMPQTCRSHVIGVMDKKGVRCGRGVVTGIRCWVNGVLAVGTQVGCGTVKLSNSNPGGTEFVMLSE